MSGDKTQPSPQWRNILITPPPATQNKTMGQANDNRGRAGTNTPELPMLRNGGDGSIYPLPTWDENNARNMQEETTTRTGKRSNLPSRYLARKRQPKAENPPQRRPDNRSCRPEGHPQRRHDTASRELKSTCYSGVPQDYEKLANTHDGGLVKSNQELKGTRNGGPTIG